jgi:hypothetical protein
MCREAPRYHYNMAGDRDIVASEAATVLRIFQEFASGNRASRPIPPSRCGIPHFRMKKRNLRLVP